MRGAGAGDILTIWAERGPPGITKNLDAFRGCLEHFECIYRPTAKNTRLRPKLLHVSFSLLMNTILTVQRSLRALGVCRPKTPKTPRWIGSSSVQAHFELYVLDRTLRPVPD